jgi:hypothetical protein
MSSAVCIVKTMVLCPPLLAVLLVPALVQVLGVIDSVHHPDAEERLVGRGQRAAARISDEPPERVCPLPAGSPRGGPATQVVSICPTLRGARCPHHQWRASGWHNADEPCSADAEWG